MKDCNNCKHHKQGEHPTKVFFRPGLRFPGLYSCEMCLNSGLLFHEPKEDLDFTAVTAPAKENPEKDPNGIDAKTPGAKLDFGKAPIMQGLLQYFPRACAAVAALSALGAEKYSWAGWEKVEDGINRYGNALARHITGEAIDGEFDAAWAEANKEVLHATAVAWNSFARLELIFRKKEEENA